MPLRDWLRSPRHLIAAFLSMTLAPAAVIAALGWQLYRQDRELDAAQMAARRGQAADVMVAALEQRTVALERAMASPMADAWPADGDVAVVTIRANVVRHEAGTPLLYSGTGDPPQQPPTFAGGERLEYGDRNAAAAAVWYLQEAASGSANRRAAALVASARNFARAGNIGRALEVYARLARADAMVAGVPAALFAAWARCSLFSASERKDDLGREAGRLRGDLLDGRWRPTRAVFEANLADTDRWLTDAGAPLRTLPAEQRLVTEAVEWVVEHGAAVAAASGRTTIVVLQQPVTLLWSTRADGVRALLAGPDGTRRLWLDAVGPAADRQHVRVTLVAPASAAAIRTRALTAAATALPWTIALEERDAAGDLLRMRQRRTLWIAGLAVLAFSLLAGTSLAIRAVARELAVARLQSDFVAAVSHEFRTPLTSLRQLCDMLLDRPDVPADRRQQYYEALSRQTERLNRLVENLLDFGRMEAGTIPYRLDRIDVAAFLTDLANEFASDPLARGHRIEVATGSRETTVKADREALRTAIWNLFDNAAKYSPECDTVWVEVDTVGDTVQIRVRDRGLGIAAEEAGAIFTKFFRGERARTENIRGTGIGLAMVHRIVAAHGGRISVRSELDAGSTFTLSLPI